MLKISFYVLFSLTLILGGCTLDGTILNLLSNTPPTVTLDASTIISSQNETSTQLTGTCAPDGLMFKIKTPTTSPVITCAQGVWNYTVDLSSLSEGSQQVQVLIENSTEEINLSVFKDTTPPTGASFQLQSGASVTSGLSVTTEISGTDISEVYLTETAGCLSGGVWQQIGSVSSWMLSMGDGTKTVYFKSRDEHGNESSCINDIIILDTTAPVLNLSYSGGSTFYSTSFTLTVTPSETVSGLTISDFSATNANLSGFTNNAGTYSLVVTPITYGTVEVTLANSAAEDAVGLQNASATITRTYATAPAGYVPVPKNSDTFAVVYSNIVRICNMSTISGCVQLPTYIDSNSVTVTLTDAKLLLNGNVIAVGYALDGSFNKAITALYNAGTSTWTELDRYTFEPTKPTEAYALAISPLGSVAVATSARDTSNTMYFVTRELIAGSGSWQTTDTFNIGGAIGSPSAAAYASDETLFIAGTLYTSTPTGTGIIRKKDGTNQTWATLDQYIHSSLETKYIGLDVKDDKVFIVGWIGYSPRQLIIRDCVVSTAICTTRKVTGIGGDTYASKVVTNDGDTLLLNGSNYGGPSGSRQYFQVSYVISTDTFTLNHTYQISSGKAAFQISIGLGSDGRFWGYGSGHNGTAYQQFLTYYSSTGVPLSTYNY